MKKSLLCLKFEKIFYQNIKSVLILIWWIVLLPYHSPLIAQNIGAQFGASYVRRPSVSEWSLDVCGPIVEEADMNIAHPVFVRYVINDVKESFPYVGLGMSGLYMVSGQADLGVTLRQGRMHDVVLNLSPGIAIGFFKFQVHRDLVREVTSVGGGFAVMLPAVSRRSLASWF